MVQSKKYDGEKARIEDGRKEFGWACVYKGARNRPINFPSNLEEIAEMTTWLREAIQTHQLANDVAIDTDLVNLSVTPSFTALSYKKIKAYGNHFLIEDQSTNMLVTYDSGVASVFQQSEGSEDVVLGVIQYVGILKQILKLDHGPMSSPIVLFRCSWVQNGTDNRGNPTYKRDNAGFLLANFRHLHS